MEVCFLIRKNLFGGGDEDIKKIWNFIITLFLCGAALLLIAFAVPRLFGYTPYIVASGSMEPEYPVGSLVYVESVDPAEVTVGDAITFYMAGSDMVATHQVYEINEQDRAFFTQGINNRDENGEILHDAQPVSFQSLIGKPRLCIPYLGYINQFCTTAPGIYILLGSVLAIAAISFFMDRRPEKKTKNNE
ncbi:hypothetical protein EUCA11A_40010 [Eubacterium callanderi]|uniref:signal peptidase I n=1 Tax=Eubacterium callanderi TaxID=53442 RepID=UPI0029FEF06E|nr:signal peptidase I [Eubacterium callanderi]WPK69811.1 hypothetical protein EUCA2A_40010 [Eubacterium callanderi]WPK74109.1 hypothetical protein EUCA11A_40010 [Eubacterium callanderi]